MSIRLRDLLESAGGSVPPALLGEPVPLDSVDPSWAYLGEGPQDLVAYGAAEDAYDASAVVLVNGVAMPTTLVDPAHLSFTVNPTGAYRNLPVRVEMGGRKSAARLIGYVTRPPVLTTLTPSWGVIDTGMIPVTLGGSFLAGDAVLLNSAPAATFAFVNATTMTVSIDSTGASESQNTSVMVARAESRSSAQGFGWSLTAVGLDVNTATVAEVICYAEDHLDQVAILIAMERAGRNRSTLIAQLEALLA